MNVLETLKKYWGYPALHKQQQMAVNAILESRDVLTLLPTGSGKSLCFQVPTMMSRGLCIVISPLVALIEDQVSSLKRRGIKAIGLSGSYSIRELGVLLDNCIFGGYKFLYLSPERLQQDFVQNRIAQMQVNLIAVDEAHCISQWGQDFRPDYRAVALLRELHPKAPVIALTATPTPRVVKDILVNLNLKDPTIVRDSLYQTYMGYHVVRYQNKLKALERILIKQPGAAIVYVNSRKASVEYAYALKRLGYAVAHFHGGLSNEEKRQILQHWIDDKLRVVVATSAFGMGIDKPDVRTVIHLHIPSCIEDYYQEAGRAGRDKKPSKAILIIAPQDFYRTKNQYLGQLPDTKFVKLVYKKLCSQFQLPYGENVDEVFHFDFYTFCNKHDLNVDKTRKSVKLLNQYGVIRLSQHSKKSHYVKFLVSGKVLQEYLSGVPSMESIVNSILRTYVGLYRQNIHIDIPRLSRKINIAPALFKNGLKRLKDDNIINWENDLQDTKIEFLLTREDDRNINPFKKHIEANIKVKHLQVSKIIDYVNDDDNCKARLLLRYFGEDKADPCGQCSVCISKNTNSNRNSKSILRKQIKTFLSESPRDTHSIMKKFTFGDRFIMETLTEMLDEDMIVLDKKQEFQLR